MSGDAEMLLLLQAIQDGDVADAPMDSDTLITKLGWTAKDVAAVLTAAKDQMLIWGSRVGGVPAPRFADLELTVQGRRFMAAATPRP